MTSKEREYYTDCVTDVITDLLVYLLSQTRKIKIISIAHPAVQSIPTLIVCQTRIDLLKKLVLTAIFSATILVISVAITRLTLVNLTWQVSNCSWVYFRWSIEAGVSIIVA